MSSRRWLLAVAALAAVLHGVGMARTPLPAQDGLKFLRVAREFQARPVLDVIRSSDQHPLYSAFIALAEPPLALVLGHGPLAWRLAAQGVSAVASVLLLWPLHSLARRLFGDRSADLAVFLYALLPFSNEIGHETLSDALALSFTVAALACGEATLRSRSWLAAVGCGVFAGLGFWTRPEVALVPPMVVLAGAIRWRPWADEWALAGRLAGMAVVTGLFVGGYAVVKGELSEKLSLRWSTALGLDSHPSRKLAPQFPKGLNDPRFDFTPKEESDAPTLRNDVVGSARQLVREWGEGVTYLLIPVAFLGLRWGRSVEGSEDGKRLLLVYAVAFAAIAVRHATTLGYLSGRHALTLIVVTIPFAASGTLLWVDGFARRWRVGPILGRRLALGGLLLLAVVGITAQSKAGHPSRWGHLAAGSWLRDRAEPDAKVLDTRGWASFVRGVPGYDYWHVRQALSDRQLRYVVVGADELAAPSRRAATLRAMLAYAGEPVAEFSGREDGRGTGVKVYRFDPPKSWEGIKP